MNEKETIKDLKKCIEDLKDGDLYGVADELQRIANEIYDYARFLEESDSDY